MACVNCGMTLSKKCVILTRVDDTEEGFCDESCAKQHIRDNSRGKIQRDITALKALTKSKLTFSFIIFLTSLLQRKPRDEIQRLYHLYKKELCVEIDEAMEEHNNKATFVLGEMFKMDYDFHIEAWCAPNT